MAYRHKMAKNHHELIIEGGAVIISSRPKSSKSKENCEKCKKLIEYTFGNGEFPADILKIKRVGAKSQKAQRGKSGRAIAAYSAEKKEDKCRKLIKQIFGSNDKFSSAAKRAPVDKAILQTVSQVITTGNDKNSGYVDKSRINVNETKDNIIEGCHISTKHDTTYLAEDVRSDMKPLAFDVYIPSLPTVSILTSDPVQLNINQVKMESLVADRIESPICPVYLNAAKSRIHIRHKSTTSQIKDSKNTQKPQKGVSDSLCRIYMPRYRDYSLDGKSENTEVNVISLEKHSRELADKVQVDVLKHTTQIGVPHKTENEPVKKGGDITAYYERPYFKTHPSKHGKDEPQRNVNPKSPDAPSKQTASPIFPQSPLRRPDSDPYHTEVKVPKPSGNLGNFVASMIDMEKPQKPSGASTESLINEKESYENNLDITEMTFTEERTGLHFISPLKRPKLYDSLPPTKTDLDVIENIAVKFYGKRPPLSHVDSYSDSNQNKATYQDNVLNLSKRDNDVIKLEDQFTKSDSNQNKGSNQENDLPKEDIAIEGQLTNLDSNLTKGTNQDHSSSLPKVDTKLESKTEDQLTKLDSNLTQDTNQENTLSLPKEDKTEGQFAILESPVSNKNQLTEDKAVNLPMKTKKDGLPPLYHKTSKDSEYPWSPLNSRSHQCYFENNMYLQSLMADKFHTKETHENEEKKVQAKVAHGDKENTPAETPNKGLDFNPPPSPLRITLSNTFEPVNKDKTSKYKTMWYTIEDHCGPLKSNQTENVILGDTRFVSSTIVPDYAKKPRMQVIQKEKSEAKHIEAGIHECSEQDRVKASSDSSQEKAETNLTSSQEKLEANLASSQQKVETDLVSTPGKEETHLLSKLGAMPPIASPDASQEKVETNLASSQEKVEANLASSQQKVETDLVSTPVKEETHLLSKLGAMPPMDITDSLSKQQHQEIVEDLSKIPEDQKVLKEQPKEKHGNLGMLPKMIESNILSKQSQEIQGKSENLPEWLNKQSEDPKSKSNQPEKGQEKSSEMLSEVLGKDTQNTSSNQTQEIKDKPQELHEWLNKQTEDSKLLSKQQEENKENSEMLETDTKETVILSKPFPEIQTKSDQQPETVQKPTEVPKLLSEQPQEIQEKSGMLSVLTTQDKNILSEQPKSPRTMEKLSGIPTIEIQENQILSEQQQKNKETEKLSEMLRKARLRSRLEYCQSYYTYMMMKQNMVVVCQNCGQIGNRCGCPPCLPNSSPPTSSPQGFTPCSSPNKVPPSPSPIPPKIPSPPVPPYCKPKKECPPPVNASIGTCPKGCQPRRSICDPRTIRPKKNKSPCDKMTAADNLKSFVKRILDDISPPRVDNP